MSNRIGASGALSNPIKRDRSTKTSFKAEMDLDLNTVLSLVLQIVNTLLAVRVHFSMLALNTIIFL